MEPMKHEVETESVPHNRQTTIDRLTTLPPELIGLIYGAIYSLTPPFNPYDVQFPHRFQPIHSRLLHFQRVNLYRQVSLSNARVLCRFATTIQGNHKLGALVERLHVSCETTDIDKVKEEYGDQTIREMVNSISPHLTKVSNLSLHSTSVVNLFYQSRSHHSLLARLTRLDLATNSTDYFAKILPLSPRLTELWIDALHSPVSPQSIPSSTQPRTSLTCLRLTGDFSDPKIKNLIASSDPAALYLTGFAFEEGLEAVQDPKGVSRLSLDTEAQEEGVESELIAMQLARFTRLTHLTLIGGLGVMSWLKKLFSDSITQLEILEFGLGLRVDTALLLECLPFLSKRLKTLKLDNIFFWPTQRNQLEWTIECQPEGAKEVIERFEAQGIKVYGSTVDALDYAESEASESDTESHGELQEEEEGEHSEG